MVKLDRPECFIVYRGKNITSDRLQLEFAVEGDVFRVDVGKVYTFYGNVQWSDAALPHMTPIHAPLTLMNAQVIK